MKFTLSWLKGHLDTEASANEIADALTSLGIEVEDVLDNSMIYSTFVIAQITDAEPHPNADKLRVCKVDDGQRILQIVCGAPNARKDIKVVLAPIGTEIPANLMVIKEANVRDVKSQGMLCSAEELCLPNANEEDGIIELPSEAVVGSKYADFINLNEVVFNVSITPNRGDAASILGLARDLAAKGIGTLKNNKAEIVEANEAPTKKITIEEPDLCSQFCYREITGLTNLKKTTWFSKLLSGIGSSSKEVLVEASNFAMLDIGRPNHIYDLDKIKGNLTVRKSVANEKFIALGGAQYNLLEGLLVIADDEKIACVAGVMGGELTKVDLQTKNILIEVAVFDPIAIAKAGRALNIISDSRFRFERRVDAANSESFMNHLTQLIYSECGGKVSFMTSVVGNAPNYVQSMKFNFDMVKKITGVSISEERSKDILKSLGFEIVNSEIKIPSYRQGDVQIAEDVVEEIIRVEGLNAIQSIPIIIEFDNKFGKMQNASLNKIKSLLISRNLNEVYTWSFYSQQDAALFNLPSLLTIANPISSDLAVMRASIVPNMLKAVSTNEARSINSCAFFELNAVYSNGNDKRQESCLTAVRYGKAHNKGVFEKEREVDFFDIKADLFAAIEAYGFNPDRLNIVNNAPTYYHPGRCAGFYLGKKLIAHAGEIHPQIQNTLGIKAKMVACELFIDSLPIPKLTIAKEPLGLPKFQPVTRDFAFVLSDSITAVQLLKTIKSVNKLITDVQIFDVYKNINSENEKSIAVTIKIQPKNKTLEDIEIVAITSELISQVHKTLGGVIRE